MNRVFFAPPAVLLELQLAFNAPKIFVSVIIEALAIGTA